MRARKRRALKAVKAAPRRKANPRRAPKRKRNSAESAKAMYERFHGRPSTNVTTHRVAKYQISDAAHLGALIDLVVLLPDNQEVTLTPKGVNLASSGNGSQAHFLGGDQKLNLVKLGLAGTLPKEHVVIGPILKIAYRTEKKFDKFKPLVYEHEFGDDGGELPTLLYDVKSQLMYVAGGSYQNLKPGIVN